MSEAVEVVKEPKKKDDFELSFKVTGVKVPKQAKKFLKAFGIKF